MSPQHPLGEAGVELAGLVDVEPADVLPHDAVEEERAQPPGLPARRQRPEGHLHVGGHQHHHPQDGVVDGIAAWRHRALG